MNPKASWVNYSSPHLLFVELANGETKRFDLTPYLDFPVYQKLRGETVCAKVKVENGVVVWDDETDLDPDLLYLESAPLLTATGSNAK